MLLIFLKENRPHFEVEDVVGAGSGLFVTRAFKKREFIINDRKTIKPESLQNNVYSFETGPPEKLVVDASETRLFGQVK